jgi:RNA polymerase sigma-70 factor, ECF subfamily
VQGNPARIDEHSFQQALTARAPRLRRWLATKIPPHLQGAISVEDVLQEICIAAFRGLPAFRPLGSDAMDRWLTCIAQRVMINTIKAAGRLKRGGCQGFVRQAPDRATSLADLFACITSPGRTPSSEAAVCEAANAVQVALASLPAARRQAVWMRYIEGQPCEAIAKAMNRTKGAVNGLLFHGLQQLQMRLGHAGKFLSGASSSLAPPCRHL